MKKYLLLSFAVGSMLNVSAAQPAANETAKAALFEKATLRTDMGYSKMNMPLSLINSKAVSKHSIANRASAIMKAPVSEENQPYYLVPEANLYFGFIPNEEGNYVGISSLQYQDGSKISELFGPAFTEQTWHNLSSYAENTDFTTAFTWNYLDPNADYEAATTKDINLKTNYGYAEVDCPLLEFDEKEYQAAKFARFGGNCYQKVGAETLLTPAIPFNIGDPNTKFAYGEVFTINSEEWGEIYEAPAEGAFAHLGIGMIVGQPAHPYGLFSVYFGGVITKVNSPRLNMKIYKLSTDDEGYYILGDVIASGYVEKENIPTDQKGYVYFPVPIIEEDGELSYETYINIDFPVYIAFDGFDAKNGDEIYLSGGFTTDENQAEYGSATNLIEFNGEKMLFPAALGFQSGDVCGNLCIGLEQFFTWMDQETEETAYEEPEVWNVPVEGGEKDFVYSPFYDLTQLGMVSGEGAFDWWDAGVTPYDENAGTQTVQIAVDALPEGVKGRVGKARIEIPGSYRDIVIIQGDAAGIDNVTEVKDAVLDWNAPVYNVMGQKVSKGFTGIAIQNGNKFIVK